MSKGGTRRVTATDAAVAAVEGLKARHGPLMFVQSGGCCDGSSPICLREGELLLGPGDVLLGEIAGCPFYVDREQYERWRSPNLVLDVGPGGGDSFSLEGADGIHFLARPRGATLRPPGGPAGAAFVP
jgi:uncharacterized protein (DUF779 family)